MFEVILVSSSNWTFGSPKFAACTSFKLFGKYLWQIISHLKKSQVIFPFFYYTLILQIQQREYLLERAVIISDPSAVNGKIFSTHTIFDCGRGNCFGKGVCNTKKLLRKAMFGIVCSKVCTLPYFCHDDRWAWSFFSSFFTWYLKLVFLIDSVIGVLDLTNHSKSNLWFYSLSDIL